MARGGVNKVIVQKAREALLARGENPSIDAVRIELGNTGSKTTIHRYLKEIEDSDPRPRASRERLSDELTELVAGLLARMTEEGGEAIAHAQGVFDEQRLALEKKYDALDAQFTFLQRQFDSQKAVLEAQTEELLICQAGLQTEITRNARLSQNCSDLELRVQEKDEQIHSLEEKHLHSRDALEHYRNAVKEQRDQEQQRHEGQVQQVQVELRQLQQTLILKQDELTRLNRDNERLLSEARQQTKAMVTQADSMQRLTGEIAEMKTAVAKAEGAKEMLQEQFDLSRDEIKRLEEATAQANYQVFETRRQLDQSSAEVTQLRLNTRQPGAS
ncbi:DNA-binding protein [Pseudomonas synxantha]|uniref:Integrase n=1 Tax=Pseudomonas synxantha TaxID=47883 RepID=A0A5D3GC13_9PSED|nr:DNA-binding protein [Pseudomonas synxantha]TYK57896.1 integrase [Pseudomonas synxantha]